MMKLWSMVCLIFFVGTLSAHAAIIARYSGPTDPTSEGFVDTAI